MSEPRCRDIALDGLWRHNPALAHLLGLCPLLAVTDSLAKAIGLGLTTIVVLMTSNLCVSLLRHHFPDPIRPLLTITIIATLVGCLSLLMQALAYELHTALGLFLPLIATHCAIHSRAAAFAVSHRPLPSLLDGLMVGLGGLGVLVAMGAVRELAGSGALFGDMQLLFGEQAHNWKIQLFSAHENFQLALLPAGGFITAGLLIALKNLIDARRSTKTDVSAAITPRQRARVTGRIG